MEVNENGEVPLAGPAEEPTAVEIELSALGREVQELRQQLRDLLESPQEQEFIRIGNFFMTRSIASLTAGMCRATQEFGDVVKDALNPFFKQSASGGKYADLSNYIAATRSQLAKHGLILFQAPGILDGVPSVTTLLSHLSNEKIGFDLPIPASKLDAWGLGSSWSYSRRYGYGPITNVASEDDDGQAAQATREDHLKKLDEKMEGQERISAAQVKAFDNACADHGRTKEQVTQFLDELNGYVQVLEILKKDYQTAIKWALNQPGENDLMGDLLAGLQQAHFKKLYALAGKKKVSNEDLHRHIEEEFKRKSFKELTHKQFNDVISWLETVSPAG